MLSDPPVPVTPVPTPHLLPLPRPRVHLQGCPHPPPNRPSSVSVPTLTGSGIGLGTLGATDSDPNPNSPRKGRLPACPGGQDGLSRRRPRWACWVLWPVRPAREAVCLAIPRGALPGWRPEAVPRLSALGSHWLSRNKHEAGFPEDKKEYKAEGPHGGPGLPQCRHLTPQRGSRKRPVAPPEIVRGWVS